MLRKNNSNKSTGYITDLFARDCHDFRRLKVKLYSYFSLENQNEFSPCDTVTCHNDGICIDDYDVATCECKPGFIGLDYSTDSCDHMG